MRFIMQLFGIPLGYLMWAMYQLIHSYGWAIILFTIVTKLLLIPLAIKQQKSTIKLQILQPKMQEIQAKYKNNPQKMNEEMQALYDRENYSMTAGCLPMLIQFPIIFGLLDVVYRPLTHLLHIPSDVMTKAAEIATGIIGTAATGATRIGSMRMASEVIRMAVAASEFSIRLPRTSSRWLLMP